MISALIVDIGKMNIVQMVHVVITIFVPILDLKQHSYNMTEAHV